MISLSPPLICHVLLPITHDKIANTVFKVECHNIYFTFLHCSASEALLILKILSLTYGHFLISDFQLVIHHFFIVCYIMSLVYWHELKSQIHHGVAISLAELNGVSICCRHVKTL